MKYLEFDNPMRRQVESLPELIKSVYPEVEAVVRTILTTPEIYTIKKIVLTGCGDCYGAALAAQNVFEKFLGLPIQVVSAVELSRYYQMKWVGETECDPLVIALSNSGQPTRVVEAVTRMRKNNAMCIAVTSDVDSPLAKAASKVIRYNIPKFESSPGVRSYSVLLMILYLIAIRFGEVRLKFTMDQAAEYRKELLNNMEHLAEKISAYDEIVFDYVEKMKDAIGCEVYGSGYDMGSAFYSHAKMYEAAGLMSTYTDTENWFHVNYFAKRTQDIITIVIANSQNEAHGRTKEMIHRLNQMGRQYLLVTDDTSLEAPYIYPMPKTEYGFLSPFLSYTAGALVAAYFAALTGEIYSRGFEGIWHEPDGAFTTVHSITEILN